VDGAIGLDVNVLTQLEHGGVGSHVDHTVVTELTCEDVAGVAVITERVGHCSMLKG
jgi:hypothetical protein